MPTLDWIGKKAVVNHHRQVPYHLLRCDRKLSCGDTDSGNLLVEGDNLLALKALLPYYAGQVKCIYIDPPYNTGEQTWTYSDHVDSVEMRRWLGKVVGNIEDLSRHDKWLCMMYPRMALLVKFLAKDGFLFVSLDDTELARFQLLMDEIGAGLDFVTAFVWKSRRNLDSRHKQKVSIDHEYVVVYHGGEGTLRGGSKDMGKYSNPDNDPRGPWMSDNLVGLATEDRRPNLHYELVNPETGDRYPCTAKGWRYSRETMAQKMAENRIMWPKKKGGRPRHKKFVSDLKSDFTGFSSVIECGNTNEGTEEVQRMLGGSPFIFPKPRSLIESLVEQVANDGDIVLDSFAGSGTMAHAVMSLNERDGRDRRFILIEMEREICKTITQRRLTKAIGGYTYKMPQGKSVEVAGLGGHFKYCGLAEPLFDETGSIGNVVRFADLAAHVFFSETGRPIPKRANKRNPFLGVSDRVGFYLLFNGVLGDKRADGGNVLTSKVLEGLPAHDGPKVVFGEGCRLGAARLKRERVTFKQLPYEIRVS